MLSSEERVNGIYARYNKQKNCVDIIILRSDCGKWENVL